MRKKTVLIALGEAVASAASSGERQPVFGVYRESEGLVQVLSYLAEPRALFRRIGWVNPTGASKGFRCSVSVRGKDIVLELDKDLPYPEDVRVLSPWTSLDDRRQGLLPKDGLSNREVHLVGAGSLGSAVGLLLVQAGVGRFRIYDNDVIDTPNLARHTCGLSDLGREKSLALAEQLSLRGSNAIGVTTDVGQLGDKQLDLLLKPADVIVATTDSAVVQFRANESIVRRRKLGVLAGAYELACGGEVVVVKPGGSGCLFCFAGFRAAAAPTLGLQERRQAYQNADENRLQAEPGLALDITYLASIVAAHVLALLDPEGSRGVLLERGGFTLVHGPSAPRGSHADLFRAPMEVVHARPIRDEVCPVCGFTSPKERAS